MNRGTMNIGLDEAILDELQSATKYWLRSHGTIMVYRASLGREYIEAHRFHNPDKIVMRSPILRCHFRNDDIGMPDTLVEICAPNGEYFTRRELCESIAAKCFDIFRAYLCDMSDDSTDALLNSLTLHGLMRLDGGDYFALIDRKKY